VAGSLGLAPPLASWRKYLFVREPDRKRRYCDSGETFECLGQPGLVRERMGRASAYIDRVGMFTTEVTGSTRVRPSLLAP
jgi:hypothetical protein